jgi:hypothetical protein
MNDDRSRGLTRRDAIVALGTTAAVVAAGGGRAMAGDDEKAGIKPLAAGKHAPVPLPFDAAKLSGISERMIRSHWENNYGGAVKNLNKVEEQLAGVTKETPGFVVAGLRERELTYANSSAGTASPRARWRRRSATASGARRAGRSCSGRPG